jgi:hypothetical protein
MSIDDPDIEPVAPAGKEEPVTHLAHATSVLQLNGRWYFLLCGWIVAGSTLPARSGEAAQPSFSFYVFLTTTRPQ